jgi:hypothetical protein
MIDEPTRTALIARTTLLNQRIPPGWSGRIVWDEKTPILMTIVIVASVIETGITLTETGAVFGSVRKERDIETTAPVAMTNGSFLALIDQMIVDAPKTSRERRPGRLR